MNDDELRKELERHLLLSLNRSHNCPRTVLRMGQYASIFQLINLQEQVYKILDVQLAYFLQDSQCLEVLYSLEAQVTFLYLTFVLPKEFRLGLDKSLIPPYRY